MNKFITEETVFDNNLQVFHHATSKENATTIVYCHGVTAPIGNFSSLYEYLKDYDFYEFSLPGHNDFAWFKEELNITSLANKICEWIKSKNLKNIILMGHSMGGGISGLVASRLGPEFIKKLILLAPYNMKCANLKSYFSLKFFLKINSYKLLQQQLDPNSKKYIANKTFIEFMEKHQQAMKILIKSLMKICSLKQTSKAYKNLLVPTYLITAEKDILVPGKATCHYFKKIIKKTEIKLIQMQNVSHLLYMDDPKTFMFYINNFINGK